MSTSAFQFFAVFTRNADVDLASKIQNLLERVSNTTPYQRLQPNFDVYNDKIIAARKNKGWSLEDLCAASGVTYSAVATQSAKNVKSPKLFDQAAIAEALGVSLDELLGLNGSAETAELVSRIHALELENAHKDGELRRVNDLMEEKDKRLSMLSAFKNILSGLLALFVLIAIGYMILDAHVLTAGLFQQGTVSFLLPILIIVIVGAIATLAYILKNTWKR